MSDTRIGAWGVSYGGAQVWNGLAAQIPYQAAAVVATWTDLYDALWPQDVARSGIVAGFAHAVADRSPLVAATATNAIRSQNMATIKAITDPRSVYSRLGSISTPVYMFQGRVDFAFDVTQALNGYLRIRGPRHLYIGQFGHSPSTFATPDISYVESQSLAWFDHFLNGAPNGIDKSKPVTLAAATGSRRVSYDGVPKTKIVTVGFRGTSAVRNGPVFRGPLETFGVSILKVQVARLSHYPRLVAVVFAGSRVITHGAVVPHKGLNSIRLANYVQYLPRGSRLRVQFGPDGGTDVAYLGFGDAGTISLGSAVLSLQALTKPVSK